MLTSDFYYDGKRISWDYIRQLHDDQKEKNLRHTKNNGISH